VFDFLFGTHWSPQEAIREDQTIAELITDDSKTDQNNKINNAGTLLQNAIK
jgi:hypothetical protein